MPKRRTAVSFDFQSEREKERAESGDGVDERCEGQTIISSSPKSAFRTNLWLLACVVKVEPERL